MRPDRRVNPAMRPLIPQHSVMQGFAHAVQALKFEPAAIVSGHMQHGCHRMRVVGRELRVDPVTHVQQLARAGDIADVGVGLAGKDRESI